MMMRSEGEKRGERELTEWAPPRPLTPNQVGAYLFYAPQALKQSLSNRDPEKIELVNLESHQCFGLDHIVSILIQHVDARFFAGFPTCNFVTVRLSV
jgi:hypothetical protein